MPRVIEVTVSPQGETTVQTKGYAGADCLRASKFLEQALGVVAADRKTAEFRQEAAAEQQVRQWRNIEPAAWPGGARRRPASFVYPPPAQERTRRV